ncbi:MAG: DUF2390 domain-containing protein [Natronospirillum sp.]|uniref:DUF2390 domain-containing protein n=1 Tax=Natronospirillum sp. TaxID=2812955 RepID=UPI002A1EB2D6|nr:DUF2390 domain-containing protein [Natronospirillum sp.]
MSVISFLPPQSPPPPIWSFAGQIYTQVGVATHLLSRQEQDQIWINDWLFALWLAHKGNTVAVDFRCQISAWQHWRDQVIVPWRRYRKRLKASSMAGDEKARRQYQRAKQAELSLEWHDQQYLWRHRSSLSAGPEPTTRDREQCLSLSLQRLSGASTDTLSDSVSLLLSALEACTDSASWSD